MSFKAIMRVNNKTVVFYDMMLCILEMTISGEPGDGRFYSIYATLLS
jgi:hypothetical protein